MNTLDKMVKAAKEDNEDVKGCYLMILEAAIEDAKEAREVSFLLNAHGRPENVIFTINNTHAITAAGVVHLATFEKNKSGTVYTGTEVLTQYATTTSLLEAVDHVEIDYILDAKSIMQTANEIVSMVLEIV